MSRKLNLNIKADTSVIQPLLNKLELRISALEPVLFKRVGEAFELLLNSGDLFFQITTVEHDSSTAGAGELLVTFYPSDRFLVFARAVFAGEFDSLVVKK
ncbi:hypothetical protein [Catenovulum sediminis]|uniref:Uncharacterized protein n=1 Tax=Catenovulum sediminis TaxID=1740262 RepID=A0ABV1RKX6_9ALTE